MTAKERSGLEQMLFIYANTHPDLRRIVQKVHDDCAKVIELGRDWSEAKFGMRYCELILDSTGKQCPNFKEICKQVGEPVSTYYFYRKQLLEKIYREIQRG